jgi:hypothetical protein
MTIMVVKVVVAIVVALRKAAMIAPITVALVMATVAIEGLGISATDIAPWPRATEIAAGVRSRTAIRVATSVVGERARAARAAA